MVAPQKTSIARLAQEAAAGLLQRFGHAPEVAMLLGTGHHGIAERLDGKIAVRREELPAGLRFATDHPLHFGFLEGTPVIVADPPMTSFEGATTDEAVFPVRVMQAMRADLLVLTAGAASLTRQHEAGALAVIEDHINLSGFHLRLGAGVEDLGPRFPDMSDPYPQRWRQRAREVAAEIGVPCLPAIFAAVPGPSLPTKAEYRFLRRAGADLVGMSLVPEALAAVHAGIEVLALVGITQEVQVENHAPVSIEAMIDAADLAAPRMAAVLAGVVGGLRP